MISYSPNEPAYTQTSVYDEHNRSLPCHCAGCQEWRKGSAAPLDPEERVMMYGE